MPNFCIQAVGGADTERYWVNAESEREARRLVALNAVGLAAAEDVSLFSCVQDVTKTPPATSIYRSDFGPIVIERR